MRTWPEGCQWKGGHDDAAGLEARGGHCPAEGSVAEDPREDPAVAKTPGVSDGAGGQEGVVDQELQGPWTFHIRSDDLQPLYQVGCQKQTRTCQEQVVP